MASTVTATSKLAVQPSTESVLLALSEARERTLALIAHLDERQLSEIHSPIMSPLAWDLGHIAAYEDLWLAHRLHGLPLLREELAQTYDAFETPRALRGEIELLDPEQARTYMRQVRERTAQALVKMGAGDGTICEMVIRHELQHSETMRQTMALAGLLPAGEPPWERLWAQANTREALARETLVGAEPEREDPTAKEPGAQGSRVAATKVQTAWLELEAGEFAIGAGDESFAYDNERPRHMVTLSAFQIASRPVSNAEWMDFVADAGYERREWWSQEGWAFKQEHHIACHPTIPDLAARTPRAPVCHVSWFEADAFARAQDARLPSELEWERAGASLTAVGQVWEWTSSSFAGYPGFVAYPYKEYSEVFFGADYRVLRGGSWATSERVKTLTFRNWDLPQRRQIFAGLRLARDCA